MIGSIGWKIWKEKASLIWRGFFSKFYKYWDRYFLKTNDIVKEAYARDSLWNNHSWKKRKHFPNLISSNETIPGIKNDMSWFYETELYFSMNKVDHPEACLIFKKIKSIYDKYNKERLTYSFAKFESKSCAWTDKIVTDVCSDKTLPKKLREELQEVFDIVLNLGSEISFEISPRNIKVDKDWNLILLDVFFDSSQLKK